MENSSPTRRKHVPTALMREKLIANVVTLTQSIPYSEINARRIADEAGVDPKTIFRCFPTLQDLYLATLADMHQRVVELIAGGEGGDLRPVAMAEEMTRFAVWMNLTGVASEQINSVNNGGETSLKPYSLALLGIGDETSTRAQAAVYCLMMSFLTAQVTVAPLQKSVFAPDVLNDATALLFALSQQLPDVTKVLGWSDHSA